MPTLQDLLKQEAPPRGVSDDELKTLLMALDGKSADEIAELEGLSAVAIRKRLGKAFAKFGITDKGPGKLQKLQLLLQNSDNSFTPVSIPKSALDNISPHQDWGEAPDVEAESFYGRTEEQEKLKNWILKDQCRLVAVLGMAGIGKTTFVGRVAREIEDEFEYVIWRSLRNAPLPDNLLEDLLEFLPHQESQETTTNFNSKLSDLMECLKEHRCLLILDNTETILKSGDFAGHYEEKYKNYGVLFKRIGNELHKSCLIITSREKPREIVLLEGETSPVRSLPLAGLGEAAKKILQAKGLSNDNKWENLIKLYQGNPFALNLIAKIIQELFAGNVADFLGLSLTVVLKDISVLLEDQFNRLNPLEKEIVYWLALEPISLSIGQLQNKFLLSIPPSDLLNALKSLNDRSLLEKTAGTFTLQPTVKEFVRNQFIEQVCQEIKAVSSSQNELKLLKSHRLINSTSQEDGREEKTNTISSLVKDKLYIQGNYKTESEIVEQIDKILSNVQGKSKFEVGYAEENLKNLLSELKMND
ncbi:NB-ARC domain-containing protein [Aerosakkonemataceae cyanobacterium BLCC-F50]|uniref:NB-ARC domain-containing protein n=1 Tax=Floridaenema flaviceps BLCC-F50 TaxID=3153642 RepID=A0ABV4XKU3_9CYAN